MKNVILKLALIVSIPLFAYFVAQDPLIGAWGTAIVFWPAVIMGIIVLVDAHNKSKNNTKAENLSIKTISIVAAASWAVLAFANLFYFK
jgi:hypothetical protein